MKLNHLLCLLLFVVSCNTDTLVQTEQAYFDTNRFLEALYPDSSSRILEAVKTIEYDDQVSRQEFTNYDISEDLQLLEKMNINNPNWMGKYTIDSISSGEDKSEIRYTAIDPDLNIKMLTVLFSSGEPTGFKAEYERRSLISDLHKTIEFNKRMGYKIYNQSDRLFAEPSSVAIELKYGKQ